MTTETEIKSTTITAQLDQFAARVQEISERMNRVDEEVAALKRPQRLATLFSAANPPLALQHVNHDRGRVFGITAEINTFLDLTIVLRRLDPTAPILHRLTQHIAALLDDVETKARDVEKAYAVILVNVAARALPRENEERVGEEREEVAS